VLTPAFWSSPRAPLATHPDPLSDTRCSSPQSLLCPLRSRTSSWRRNSAMRRAPPARQGLAVIACPGAEAECRRGSPSVEMGLGGRSGRPGVLKFFDYWALFGSRGHGGPVLVSLMPNNPSGTRSPFPSIVGAVRGSTASDVLQPFPAHRILRYHCGSGRLRSVPSLGAPAGCRTCPARRPPRRRPLPNCATTQPCRTPVAPKRGRHPGLD